MTTTRITRSRSILVALAVLTTAAAQARGVSPYLPLNLSPEIERKIERLLILADVPVATRPFAAATVLDALPDACTYDAALCNEVKDYLSSYMRKAGIAYLSVAATESTGAGVALPNRHGETADSHYAVAAAAYWQPGDYLLVSAGALAYSGESTPTGSVVSLGIDRLQIDVGYRDRSWSPLTDSAMTVSTEAATLPSITVSNYAPLTKWKIRYEAFIGELDESSNIALETGGTTTGKPRLAGLHLSIQPLPGWTLGVNRIMQYGGGSRPDSFGDLVDAFFNPSDKDNAGVNNPTEFGNQIASFTSRFVVRDPLPFAVYFEYAGEDTSTLSNLRLGNSALSAGIDFPTLWRNFSLTVELSEWQNAWYSHHIYQDGLRYKGNVLGHWGADWRGRDEVGARSWLAKLGWQPPFGGWLETSYRQVDNEDYGAAAYDTGRHLEARYSRRWQQFYVGAELIAGRDVFGESFSRLGAFLRF